LRTAPGKVFEL